MSVAWEDGAVLTGGGSVLAALSRDLRTFAETVGGREQMAIEAFASALEIIPRTLAENAGLDPVTTLIELKKLMLMVNQTQESTSMRAGSRHEGCECPRTNTSCRASNSIRH